MTRTAKWLVIPVILLQLSFFAFVARNRFIDGDEGAFLLASRLVIQHQRPYLDFFYNQAPLLPYVYGVWMKYTTVSWSSGRMLSALLTTLLGTLIYEHVCRQTRNWLAGTAAVLLFAFSTLVFAWFSVVKTHCLAAFFLFSAYTLTARTASPFSRWFLLAGGVALGLSVDARSYVVLLVPLFLWWIVRNLETSARALGAICFLGGFVIGILPSLYYFGASPNIFLFDNLRYHGIRSDSGLIGWWQQKILTLIELFMGSAEANGFQWSLLFVASAGFVFSKPKRDYPPRFAFQIVLLLAAVCFLPTPTFIQYLSLCIPLLIVSAVCPVSEFVVGLPLARDRFKAAAIWVVLTAIYLAAGAYDLRKYLVTGDGVPGVRTAFDRGDWRLERVIGASQAVNEVVTPGETAASFWPGDIFQTKANPVSGMENPFGLPIAEKLTAEQRTQYHILALTAIERDFAGHKPRVVVLRSEVSNAYAAFNQLAQAKALADSVGKLLRHHGYTLYRTIGGISIYVYSGS